MKTYVLSKKEKKIIKLMRKESTSVNQKKLVKEVFSIDSELEVEGKSYDLFQAAFDEDEEEIVNREAYAQFKILSGISQILYGI